MSRKFYTIYNHDGFKRIVKTYLPQFISKRALTPVRRTRGFFGGLFTLPVR